MFAGEKWTTSFRLPVVGLAGFDNGGGTYIARQRVEDLTAANNIDNVQITVTVNKL